MAEDILIISRKAGEDSTAFKARVSIVVEEIKNSTGRNVTKSAIGGEAGIVGPKKYIVTKW